MSRLASAIGREQSGAEQNRADMQSQEDRGGKTPAE